MLVNYYSINPCASGFGEYEAVSRLNKVRMPTIDPLPRASSRGSGSTLLIGVAEESTDSYATNK
jgi:hypothetical protein